MSARTHARSKVAQGFTLVEILIVVVILGILAAIVIPQFTRASESAQASSLASQLQTMRSQLELYQVQHGGAYPDLITDGWEEMTAETDAGFGPYFQQAPRNPLAPGDRTAVGAAAGADIAWIYDADTGRIRANVNTTIPKSVLEAAGLTEHTDTVDGDFEGGADDA
ncbi:MAG: prepilin-type N-terminal cleavage/methylation domain-containing protein [Phycisphaeraceae bacterium]